MLDIPFLFLFSFFFLFFFSAYHSYLPVYLPHGQWNGFDMSRRHRQSSLCFNARSRSSLENVRTFCVCVCVFSLEELLSVRALPHVDSTQSFQFQYNSPTCVLFDCDAHNEWWLGRNAKGYRYAPSIQCGKFRYIDFPSHRPDFFRFEWKTIWLTNLILIWVTRERPFRSQWKPDIGGGGGGDGGDDDIPVNSQCNRVVFGACDCDVFHEKNK